MGYARTALLMAALTGLFLAVGYLVGGPGGMLIAFLAAVGLNAFAYWNSDKMVLRMYGAQPVDAQTAPQLHAIVGEMARRAGLPMPKVYLMQNDQPNAFATGRNPEHAAVAATTGLLQRLDAAEVSAVIAHELAHVKNRDSLIMTITAAIAGAVGMLANFAWFFGGSDNRNNPFGIVGTLLVIIVAPIAAMLVQMAISRTREFAADRIGAEISGQPLELAGALRKIEANARRIDNPAADAHPATAHLFIINPLHGRSLASLFSTHPSTEERIRRLVAMADTQDQHPAGAAAAAPTAAGGPWGARPRGPWG